MSRMFMRYFWRKNPVWMVPLALPLVLFYPPEQGWFVAILAIVSLGLPLTHAVSLGLERWLPRRFRLVVVVIASATVVSLADLVLTSLGVAFHPRGSTLIASISVSPLFLWPTLVSRTGETYADRLTAATGLAAGFVLGIVPVMAVRLFLAFTGYLYADSLFVGFLIMAVGKLVINVAAFTLDRPKPETDTATGMKQLAPEQAARERSV